MYSDQLMFAARSVQYVVYSDQLLGAALSYTLYLITILVLIYNIPKKIKNL